MRKTRKQQRSQPLKGGRFLGKGGFGCAFTEPPLPCWDPKGGPPIRRSSDQISKLMRVSHAHEAMMKNQMFRKFDPTQQYFITSSHMDRCKPVLSAAYILPTDELDKCHLNPQKDGPFELLFSEMGGVDLTNITLQSEDYAPFFQSLVNVLRGMAVAHTHGIVHLDIKPQNIVSKRLPTGEFQTRLIDYDFSADLKYLAGRGDRNIEQLYRPYLFFPFDSMFMDPTLEQYYFPQGSSVPHAKLLKIQADFRQLITNWFGMFSPVYTKGFVLGDKHPFSVSYQRQIGFTDYYTNYAPSLAMITTDYKRYIQLVDSYMLGYTLGLMLTRCLNCKMVCMDSTTGYYAIVFKIRTPQHSQYNELSSNLTHHGYSQDIQNWIQELEANLLLPYMRLVDTMTNMDVAKRIPVAVAVARYEALLPLFDVYFTKEAIEQYLIPTGIVTIQAQPQLPYVPSPTDLAKIQISPIPATTNRTYQIPPTNLRKIRSNLFQGGRKKRARKTHKKRGRN
jgi:serine/threonine protein kinase